MNKDSFQGVLEKMDVKLAQKKRGSKEEHQPLRKRIGEAISKHYGLVLSVFDYFCATAGSGNALVMSFNSWNAFIMAINVTDQTKYCNQSAADTIFIVSNLVAKNDASNKNIPAKAFVCSQFMEALVRLAIAKYVKQYDASAMRAKGTNDPAVAFELLVQEYIVPGISNRWVGCSSLFYFY